MLVTRTNSAKHRKASKHKHLAQKYVSREEITAALEARVDALEAYQGRIRGDVDVLEDVGLGGAGRAEALRRILSESHAEQTRMQVTAADMDDCGRKFLQGECDDGHVEHKPYYCNKPTCADCAARRSRRLTRIYAARVAGALIRAPRGVKARLVTLPMRPRDTEGPREAFARCKPLVQSTLRISFGIPQTSLEWRQYFELDPITGAEFAKVPVHTRGGRRRSMATRTRMAQTHRRRSLKMQPSRRGFGCVTSIEFGESGALAHGHALVVGKYVDQRQLSRAWRIVTGGTSYVAHIRAVDNVRAGAAEVCKYIAKFGAHSATQLVELYAATLMFSKTEDGDIIARQRRRLEPLGVLRGKLEEEGSPAPACAVCGLPLHVVGSIPWAMWQMGVRDVPEERRYRRRPRDPD